MANKKVKFSKKKKSKRVVKDAVVHVLASYNNTFITITDPKGQTLVTYTPAKLGFKNTKKRTAYAATQAAMACAQQVMEKFGTETVKVYLKGVGLGRNPAVKGLASAGLKVKSIIDVSRPPFNGPRPRKKPRK